MYTDNQLAEDIESIIRQCKSYPVDEDEIKKKFEELKGYSMRQCLDHLGKRSLGRFLEEFPEKFYRSGCGWNLNGKRYRELYVIPAMRSPKAVSSSSPRAGEHRRSHLSGSSEKDLEVVDASDDKKKVARVVRKSLWGFFVSFAEETGVFYEIWSRSLLTVKKEKGHKMCKVYRGTKEQLELCENNGSFFELLWSDGELKLKVTVVKPDLTMLDTSQLAEFDQGIFAGKFGYVSDTRNLMGSKPADEKFWAWLVFKEENGRFFDIDRVFEKSTIFCMFSWKKQIRKILGLQNERELEEEILNAPIESERPKISIGICLGTNVHHCGHTYSFLYSPVGCVAKQEMSWEAVSEHLKLGEFYKFSYKPLPRYSELPNHWNCVKKANLPVDRVPLRYSVEVKPNNHIEIAIKNQQIFYSDLKDGCFFMKRIGSVRILRDDSEKIQKWLEIHPGKTCLINGVITSHLDALKKGQSQFAFLLTKMRFCSTRKRNRSPRSNSPAINKKVKVDEISDKEEDEAKEEKAKEEEEEFGDLYEDYYKTH